MGAVMTIFVCKTVDGCAVRGASAPTETKLRPLAALKLYHDLNLFVFSAPINHDKSVSSISHNFPSDSMSGSLFPISQLV